MLFKRSKHPFNNDPTTPKFKVVALPPTSPLGAAPSPGWKIPRSASVMPDRQPSISYTSASRHRKDSNAGYATDAGYGARERKVYDDDDIRKPPKSKYSPTTSSSGGTPPIKIDVGSEKPAKPKGGWLKSAMKGGSYYLPTSGKMKTPPRVEPTPEPVQVYTVTSRPAVQASHPQSHFGHAPHHAYSGQVPAHPHYQAQSNRPVLPHSQGVNTDASYRPRQQSLPSRSSTRQAPVADPSNYVPLYVRQPSQPSRPLAPITLYWPLVEYASRAHLGMPRVYYDIGFNPDWDGYEAKVQRQESYYSKMTDEERNLPFSMNTHLSELTIICEKLEKWPVKVTSTTGIRVIDVYKAIYKTFAQILTRDEVVEAANKDPDYFRRCQRHFRQRCADSPGIPRVTERDGMCRVDLLKGRRVFRGLKQDAHDPFTFHMRIEDIWTQSRRN